MRLLAIEPPETVKVPAEEVVFETRPLTPMVAEPPVATVRQEILAVVETPETFKEPVVTVVWPITLPESTTFAVPPLTVSTP